MHTFKQKGKENQKKKHKHTDIQKKISVMCNVQIFSFRVVTVLFLSYLSFFFKSFSRLPFLTEAIVAVSEPLWC